MTAARPATVTRAVIDIGSNSIRLVVYAGPERLPWPILNEKVPAALGATLAADGHIPIDAMELAVTGLARFATLLAAMGLKPARVVATAAARDAANGPEFLARVRALGLDPELLTGEQEATGSALGVLSGIPDADGVVGDLGGGSLELVEVAGGAAGRGDSFPLGTLRLPSLRAGGEERFGREVKAMLAAGWRGAAEGRTLYLVGGSWRALAHLDLHLAGSPLYDPQAHALSPERVGELGRLAAMMPPKRLRDVPGISAARAASLDNATALLGVLVRELRPARIVTSAFGLRDGLLFAALDPAVARLDPLETAARDYAAASGGDLALADALDGWLEPAFETRDRPGDARLRHVACLLAGIGERSERALRARRGVESALHERWAAIDAASRAMLAQALHTAGGQKGTPADLLRLAAPADLDRAVAWGHGIRFGTRLGGATAEVLRGSTLRLDDGVLALGLPGALARLYDGIDQRHRALADQLGLGTRLDVDVDMGAAGLGRWFRR